MNVKTEALDRVLEALSPALTTELDRLVEETRETLEQEFQIRLQAATRDAETMGTSAAQLQLERVIEEVKKETRQQVTAELAQQLTQRIEAATTQARIEAAEERTRLEAAMTQLQDEWSAERAKLQAQVDEWKTLAEAQRQFSEASSQPDSFGWLSPLRRVWRSISRKPMALRCGKAGGTELFPRSFPRARPIRSLISEPSRFVAKQSARFMLPQRLKPMLSTSSSLHLNGV